MSKNWCDDAPKFAVQNINHMNTTQKANGKLDIYALIMRLLKIEHPRNLFEHNIEELEHTLFRRDHRHTHVALK